jgi:hypothetical protein
MHTVAPSSRQRLEACVLRLLGGSWRFIQLRGEPLGIHHIGGDDVDLLGTRDSVDALCRAAFDWARAGDCHFRIDERNRRKVRFTLISMDGSERLELDIWLELWQVDRRTRCLTYLNCEPLLSGPPAAIRRLPIALEACVYVQHLVSKNKDITGSSATERLGRYITACGESGHAALSAGLERILREKEIDATTLAEFLAPLEAAVPMPSGQSELAKLSEKIADGWLGMPRRLSIISVMGCDGAGKTTLAGKIAEDCDTFRGVFTGKHLFRKSFIYKLSVIFIRPLLFQSREKYDETMAPLVYLRGSLGLRLKLLNASQRILLIDRSLVDFLMIDRKTDHPRFSRCLWLSRFFGRRIPVIHCVLPYEELVERKDEMTRAGHDSYDVAMCLHHSRRTPTDYVVFNNSGTLDSSAEAVKRIITWMQAAG